jgi:hypothetical protein
LCPHKQLRALSEKMVMMSGFISDWARSSLWDTGYGESLPTHFLAGKE